MELFGDRLRSARENRKYTLDQVARDTRISRKYLDALERGDLSQFPGETYLIGFLKSYAEYLDLDQEEIVTQYKNYKIQEQPVPIAELLNPSRISPRMILIISILGSLTIIGIALIVYFSMLSKPSKPKEGKETVKVEDKQDIMVQGKEYLIENEIQTQWFNPGDILMIPVSDKTYKIELYNVERIVTLKLDKKTFRLNQKESLLLDLNEDAKNDLRIIYNDSEFADSQPRFNLGLYRTFGNETIASLTPGGSPQPSATGSGSPSKSPTGSPRTTGSPSPGQTPSPGQKVADNSILKVKQDTSHIILEVKKPEPYTISITFRGNCFFRYLLDRKTRDQRFFLKNDILPLDVNNEAKLWIANAGSVRAQINGKDVVFGRSGQVVTKLIHWVKNEQTGLYNLEMVSLY
jgi:cytoskeleton protein RodZ